MGLFNAYLKPGPGIDKNIPPKKGVSLFIDILGRKFFKLIEANFLYFIISLPYFVVSMFFLAPQFSDMIFEGHIYEADFSLNMGMNILFSGMLFNFYGAGPASASYAYITRAFSRGEYTWILSDGIDKFRENFRYSMIISLIDISFIFVTGVALRFYSSSETIAAMFLYCLILIVFVIYAMSHIFIYQVIVTFNCTFREVIKNSLILTAEKLPMCILLSLIMGIVCFIIFGLSNFISVIIYATIGLSLTRFPLEFYAARVIKKLIDKSDMVINKES